MKLKNKLMTLGLGIIAALGVGISTLNSNVLKSAKADEEDEYIYVQVKNSSDFDIGDTVILAADNRAIGGIGGNPVYTYVNYISNNNNDYSIYYFDTTDAITMEIGNGYLGDTTSYSFKVLNSDDNRSFKVHDRYLAYADGQKYYGDDGIYGTRGDVIIKKELDEFSSLNVDFDSDGFVYLSRSNEPNQYGKVENPISIHWAQEYVTKGIFGYYFGKSNTRMYRRVNIKRNNLNYYISHTIDKQEYNAGQYTVLDGLELTVTLTSPSVTFKVSYSNEPAAFEALQVIYDDNPDLCEAPFKWKTIEGFIYVTVNPNRENENDYYFSSTPYRDLRGTYLLGAVYEEYNSQTHQMNYSTHFLSLSDLASYTDPYDPTFRYGKTVSIEGNDNPVSDSSYDAQGTGTKIPEVANNVISIVLEQGSYYIKVGSDFLTFKNSDYDYYKYVTYGSKEYSIPVRVDYNNRILFGERDDTMTLVIDKFYKEMTLTKLSSIGSNDIQVKLYRYILKGNDYSNMLAFKNLFYVGTAECDPTGETNKVSKTEWISLGMNFSNLSLDCKSELASIVYIPGSEEPDSFKDMVNRYDIIISKYHDDGYNDFMNRIANGMLQTYSAPTKNVLENRMGDTTFIIVMVTSLTSITLLGALLIAKKKKEQ